MNTKKNIYLFSTYSSPSYVRSLQQSVILVSIKKLLAFTFRKGAPNFGDFGCLFSTISAAGDSSTPHTRQVRSSGKPLRQQVWKGKTRKYYFLLRLLNKSHRLQEVCAFVVLILAVKIHPCATFCSMFKSLVRASHPCLPVEVKCIVKYPNAKTQQPTTSGLLLLV